MMQDLKDAKTEMKSDVEKENRKKSKNERKLKQIKRKRDNEYLIINWR